MSPNARPIHELYTPVSRKLRFPSASDAFLIRVALNLCRVVARLHDKGQLIGDLSHSSVLVLPDAPVRLVDVDSYPLPPDNICMVGTPEYLGASLQGADRARTARERRHDAFALAVLVHQLLFSGRHPFAGYDARPSGSVAETISRTKRYRFAARLRSDPGGRAADQLAALKASLAACLSERATNPTVVRLLIAALCASTPMPSIIVSGWMFPTNATVALRWSPVKEMGTRANSTSCRCVSTTMIV